MNEAVEGVLGWEDEITVDSNDFVLLPAGEYEFTVKTFERAQTNGEGKLGVVPMAKITIEVDGKELGMVTVKDQFVMHLKTLWRISSFFAAIGMKKKGEDAKMDWYGSIGRKGICKIGTKTHNDNEYNEVKSYISKEEVQSQETTW